MLKGSSVTLRPVRAGDLDKLYAFHTDIDNRGAYFPRGILSEPMFQKRFHDNGFWGTDDGMLLIVSAKDEVLGHIEFFKTVNYLDEFELSYQLYATELRGKGIDPDPIPWTGWINRSSSST